LANPIDRILSRKFSANSLLGNKEAEKKEKDEKEKEKEKSEDSSEETKEGMF
jgi:hypothetical protein